MSVIFYSKGCEGCRGNQAIEKMKAYCKKKGVDFEERRTILWKVYEEEANSIIELNEGLKLPFFFETTSQMTLQANSLVPLETLKKWLEKCLRTPYN